MIRSVKSRLPNGLRVVAVEMPHLHVAEIAVYLKVGGRNDPLEKAGLTHFLEHMLFRGTADYPTSLELENAFDAIGGSVNAATDAETTCYYSRVHPSQVAAGLALFASMLLRPTLLGVEVEKRIVTEEALEDLNEKGIEINPDNLASSLLWPDHPLGMPTVGYLETIAAFGEADLREHLANYYVPSNTVIAVCGNISAEEGFAAAAKEFAGWTGGVAPAAPKAKHFQDKPQFCFVRNSASQIDLQVAFRSFNRFDPRMMRLRILRRILSAGGNSRLFLALRERLGIVYSVDAAISAYDETGSFSVDLSCAVENVETAVRQILDEVNRLAREEVNIDELQRVKQNYQYDLEFSRDSTYDLHVRYGWGELMDLVRHIEEDQAELAKVTADGIAATAATISDPANINVVVVGPWKGGVRRQVEKVVNNYSQRWILR